ncbi:hypothetical protein AAVH_01170 [Aphelenchoides avenae]|nr:hypothetical protein AAVH_01170 [Aphelenchus avenae]
MCPALISAQHLERHRRSFPHSSLSPLPALERRSLALTAAAAASAQARTGECRRVRARQTSLKDEDEDDRRTSGGRGRRRTGTMCGWSSPTLLSASTIFVLFGAALVVIAGTFDNWVEYEVDRREISSAMNRQSDLMARLKDQYTRNPLFFPRSYGIVNICFPEGVPSGIGSFTKITQTCVWNQDYFPDDAVRERYTGLQTQRMWFMRANVLFYLSGLGMLLSALIAAMIGCYRQSPRSTLTTALLLIVAVLFFMCSMACFHYVGYLEHYALDMTPFYRSWEPILKQSTHQSYGWTYVLAWIGIGCIAFSAVFFLASWFALKREQENELESKHQAYFNSYCEKSMMPYTQPYGTYNVYPTPYYGQYPMGTLGHNNYYGYMTYGH